MTIIQFDERCFRFQESSLHMIIAARSEFQDHHSFIEKGFDYLIAATWSNVSVDYKNNCFIKATEDDISFMEDIIKDMDRAVCIDFEEVLESYTMSPEDDFEHMMIFCTENVYIMLHWQTSA